MIQTPPKLNLSLFTFCLGFSQKPAKISLGKIKPECVFDTWKIHYFISRNNFILTQGNKNYK